MKHVRGYDREDELPSMHLAETQVPSLRSYLYTLPSSGKFATLELFCNVSIHTLLNIMQMSCSTTKLTRKDHLVAVVDQAEKVCIFDIGHAYILTGQK